MQNKEKVMQYLREMYAERHHPHIIDSSDMGKNAIANQWHGEGVFEKRLEEEIVTIAKDGGTIHTLPLFAAYLSVTEESERLEQLLREHEEKNNLDHVAARDQESFMKELKEYTDVGLYYTYNNENDYDRDFQSVQAFNRETQEWILLISLHTGCDARWGFTDYHAFSVPDRDTLYSVAWNRCQYNTDSASDDYEYFETTCQLFQNADWDEDKKKWIANEKSAAPGSEVYADLMLSP